MSETRIYAAALIAGILASVAVAPAAWAGSSSGTIGLSLNVAATCAVNGGTAGMGALGAVGTIAFPDQSGAFGDVDGSLLSTGGVNGIAVQCSPGLAPTLTIGSGAHDSGNLRHLSSGTQQLAYHLFSDAARSNEIAIGQQIALGTATSTAFIQPVYARVNGGGAILPGGVYADTVQVTLSW